MSSEVPFLDLKAQYATIRDEVRESIDRVCERQSFIIGEETAAFEREFARFTGGAEAIAVSNGTTALELALWALGVGPGDEVVTPSWTFWATTEAILRVGAVPVFVEVSEGHWTLDPALVAAAVTPKTKVLLPVHIYGHPADLPALAAAAPGVTILEDSAQAHGASCHGRPVGSIGIASTYSFYPAKNLGAFGDAGAVVTDDAALAERLRALRDHGRSTKYEHPFAGTNARCSEIQCAVLRVKLARLRAWTDERRRLAGLYEQRLAPLGIASQANRAWAHHVRHLFVIVHPQRDRLADALAAEGIATGVHYPIPVHRQPGLQGREWRAAGALDLTERLGGQVLSLPLYPELGDAGVERVCDALERVLPAVAA